MSVRLRREVWCLGLLDRERELRGDVEWCLPRLRGRNDFFLCGELRLDDLLGERRRCSDGERLSRPRERGDRLRFRRALLPRGEARSRSRRRPLSWLLLRLLADLLSRRLLEVSMSLDADRSRLLLPLERGGTSRPRESTRRCRSRAAGGECLLLRFKSLLSWRELLEGDALSSRRDLRGGEASSSLATLGLRSPKHSTSFFTSLRGGKASLSLSRSCRDDTALWCPS